MTDPLQGARAPSPVGRRVLDLVAAEDDCGSSPLRRLQDALAALAPGEVLEVRSSVPDQLFTVRRWGARHARILADEAAGGVARVTLAPALA